jgi:hypothetical protein
MSIVLQNILVFHNTVESQTYSIEDGEENEHPSCMISFLKLAFGHTITDLTDKLQNRRHDRGFNEKINRIVLHKVNKKIEQIPNGYQQKRKR